MPFTFTVAFAGTNPTNFAQSNTCGGSVAAGANCVLNVTFRPTAAGARVATLNITTTDTAHALLTVALTGTGTAGLPAAATSLTATALGPTQVALSWTYTPNANPASSFQVQRATGNGAFATIATVNTVLIGTNTYNDATAVPGTTYRYQVITVGAGGSAQPSNIASVQTPLVTPTNLRVSFNGRIGGVGRLIIAWSDTNTVNATNFTVYGSTDGGATWTLAATTGVTTLTYQALNTVQGTTYLFRVQAINGTSGAISAFSTTLSVVAQ
jgi:hypothetical protein